MKPSGLTPEQKKNLTPEQKKYYEMKAKKDEEERLKNPENLKHDDIVIQVKSPRKEFKENEG